jgi:hypothetical protein
MGDRIGTIEDSQAFHRVVHEYWETCDARQGGIIGDINESGLLIQSPVNMSVGEELEIRVFFSLGIEFDQFQASARIIEKALSCVEGWEAYNYKLEFMRVSEEDRLTLIQFLHIREPKENCS